MFYACCIPENLDLGAFREVARSREANWHLDV
jgi:hypothetical protein